MQFHLEYQPEPLPEKIRHSDRLFLIGSCFTEQIGAKLQALKFRVMENPHGILFNPASIMHSLESYIAPRYYRPENLFFHGELWGSWDHHTRFSGTEAAYVLEGINQSQQEAHEALKQSRWLMMTLGSAFVYEQEGQKVANCHKVPADRFVKKMMSVSEVVSMAEKTLDAVRVFNPNIRFLFTISPVRHLRDGFVENNRSKSVLHLAVQELCHRYDDVHYFPAYELVIDDLRDYRFYAEDLVHPNYAATGYVWEKFLQSCLEEAALPLLKELDEIRLAARHKAFNPDSAAHLAFLKKYLAKTQLLQQKYAYLDLEKEIACFGAMHG